MKYIFIADVHIKLGQKNVPKDWQRNRFDLLAEELCKHGAKYLIIGGDLLDVANPSLEEIGLMYRFLKKLSDNFVEILLIPGNHEMLTKKVDCFTLIPEMLKDLHVRLINKFETIDGIDYIPYNILADNFTPKSKIAVTHVRGEIPPHVKSEVDLEKFSSYETVFAGDLHSYKNSQLNLEYPGSPITTSFHREEVKGSNGFFILETANIDPFFYSYEWVELKLPQLIRKTVSNEEDMLKTPYHHTIYELEGELEDLAKVKNSELLDKKVTKNVSAPATLNMSNIIEEDLVEYLSKVLKVEDVSALIAEYKEHINDSN